MFAHPARKWRSWNSDQANLPALACPPRLSLLCGFPNYPHSSPEPLLFWKFPLPGCWATVSFCASKRHQRIPHGHSLQFNAPNHECAIVYLNHLCGYSQVFVPQATSLHLCLWAMWWQFLWEWSPRSGIVEGIEHL